MSGKRPTAMARHQSMRVIENAAEAAFRWSWIGDDAIPRLAAGLKLFSPSDHATDYD